MDAAATLPRRPNGPLMQLAQWVLALNDTKVCGRLNRQFVRKQHQWAAAYVEDPANITVVPAPADGARVAFHVRIGEVDDIPLSIRIEGPTRADALRIERLAWRNHNSLPAHLRAERPPLSRKGNA